MGNFIKNALHAVRQFTVVDFGVFKIYLVCVGILFGAYFSTFFLQYISVVWIIAIITLIILFAKLIHYGCSCKQEE